MINQMLTRFMPMPMTTHETKAIHQTHNKHTVEFLVYACETTEIHWNEYIVHESRHT